MEKFIRVNTAILRDFAGSGVKKSLTNQAGLVPYGTMADRETCFCCGTFII